MTTDAKREHVPVGIVFGNTMMTVMGGPGGVVRLHAKDGRGEWREMVLGQQQARKLAALILAAAERVK